MSSKLLGMAGVLDIAPLRSFVAVADCGGFGRAATALHLSQGAVSQHVRRLEAVIGRTLVVREGRGSRFTDDGEALLREARRILASHDEALRRFEADIAPTLVIGCTEHAADQLLPAATRTLVSAFPQHQVRFRIDRGAQLRAALDAAAIDLALLLATATDEQSRDVGELDLTWYSAPAWSPPDDAPTPLVAFDEPCALRRRALETLAAQHVPAEVVCDAANLAGVKSAVRAGLGFGLMATFGHHPTGLVPRVDLPAPGALPLSISARRGLKVEILDLAADSLRDLLTALTATALTVSLP
jgi:DNA-binding transcriptional LysR family regulator